MGQIVDILMQARDLISDKEHWTMGVLARDKSGNDIPATIDAAYSFCARGALVSVINTEHKSCAVDLDSCQYLTRACSQLYNTCSQLYNKGNYSYIIKVAFVNDNFGHEAVMDIYDEAIKLAKDDDA